MVVSFATRRHALRTMRTPEASDNQIPELAIKVVLKVAVKEAVK